MDQAAPSAVHATLMLRATHRLDAVSALLANEATTVQHVSIVNPKNHDPLESGTLILFQTSSAMCAYIHSM